MKGTKVQTLDAVACARVQDACQLIESLRRQTRACAAS